MIIIVIVDSKIKLTRVHYLEHEPPRMSYTCTVLALRNRGSVSPPKIVNDRYNWV